MQLSSFDTYTIPPLGTTNPATIAKAASIPLRVLVSNVGPVLLFLACEATSLTPQPGTTTFRVLAGDQIVFVLAPKQSLYAIGAGAGGLLSVSLSEALPGRE